MEPRRFTMRRGKDASGVSGLGRVLDGIVFHNGTTVVCWRTDVIDECAVCEAPHGVHPVVLGDGSLHQFSQRHGHSSVGVYPSFEAFEHIHVRSHPANETSIEWAEPETTRAHPRPTLGEIDASVQADLACWRCGSRIDPRKAYVLDPDRRARHVTGSPLCRA